MTTKQIGSSEKINLNKSQFKYLIVLVLVVAFVALIYWFSPVLELQKIIPAIAGLALLGSLLFAIILRIQTAMTNSKKAKA